MLELVIGGARSGKSAYAEQCAKHSQREVLYIATATAEDHEMQQRISHHKNIRPVDWQTIEEPIHLSKAVLAKPEAFVIVDCLTLWMTNILALDKKQYENEMAQFFTAIDNNTTPIIFVTNEIGIKHGSVESTSRALKKIGFTRVNTYRFEP